MNTHKKLSKGQSSNGRYHYSSMVIGPVRNFDVASPLGASPGKTRTAKEQSPQVCARLVNVNAYDVIVGVDR